MAVSVERHCPRSQRLLAVLLGRGWSHAGLVAIPSIYPLNPYRRSGRHVVQRIRMLHGLSPGVCFRRGRRALLPNVYRASPETITARSGLNPSER